MRKSDNYHNEAISFVNDEISHGHNHNHKKPHDGSHLYDHLHMHDDFSNEIEIGMISHKNHRKNNNESDNDVL
jgi:hypothetical protein